MLRNTRAEVKEGEIEVTVSEGLISVHAVKADIHRVVAQIAHEVVRKLKNEGAI